MADSKTHNLWLHRFAILVAFSTFILIFIGGLVTSTGSGLAVPDWPNTFGHFMFSFPLSQMVGGILYEHGHRMIASIVGFLTVILAVWLWLKDDQKWLRWFGIIALLAVITQGALGGLTVLMQLPTLISVFHGCLAQGFFLMTIVIAMATSKGWHEDSTIAFKGNSNHIFQAALYTTIMVYIQLILGATMRHSGAGLAIPDFPLAFGKIIPEITTQAIAIHFLHRIGAVLVSIFVLYTVIKIMTNFRNEPKLTKPAYTLAGALVLQITLAAITIWTQKAVLPTTAHVATGAFILGNSLFLTLRVYLLLKPTPNKEMNYIPEPITTT